MSCTVNSLLIPIQLCGGKKTKHPRYNNVSRVFLSFSLAFNAIPRYGYVRIRKIFRNQLSNKQELHSLLIIFYSAISHCGYKKGFVEDGKTWCIINAPSLGSKKVSVTFLLRNIIVTSFIIKSRKQVFPLLKRIKCDTIKVLLM